MYVKATFRAGHVRAGKYYEMVRHLRVGSLLDTLTIAKIMPRVKKNHLALISCRKITEQEYLIGLDSEKRDSYLRR